MSAQSPLKGFPKPWQLEHRFSTAEIPTVSFVIPAYNEEAVLGRTLVAIQDSIQSFSGRVEIIVVDDASTDSTASIAAKHGARVISVIHRQIASTRNAGAIEARGDVIVFVDADTIVNEAVVFAAINAIRKGAVGGGCTVRFSGRLPFYGHVVAAIGIPLYRLSGLAAGCFLFCTREAFAAAGGFDERLFAAEEVAMSRALRNQGRFVILRETVMTSGRKLRAHSGREVLNMVIRVIIKGPEALRQRKGLDIWYGKRRVDPDTEA